MSSVQRGPRRLSARIQEKEHAEPSSSGAQPERRINGVTSNKKRKMNYDEVDDGFHFARVKKQKPRAPAAQPDSPRLRRDASQPVQNGDPVVRSAPDEEQERVAQAKKRRNKMSFSTPKVVGEKPSRRSKRLSQENNGRDGSPRPKTRRKGATAEKQAEPQQPVEDLTQLEKSTTAPAATAETTEDHSATKIALPFADTPVIRRNKAMREGKTGKGDRRSSLGLRGRRASSLIETGNSNALPHAEVEVWDFYKHIESESLPEPKRMRQLLTWCATRAMGDKPSGTDFEDVSVKQAARVIQEEILRDLSNKSEMSDWFSREDARSAEVVLQERPHPKNIQNEQKILELEQQLKRLRAEKNSLEAILKPPAIEPIPPPSAVSRAAPDTSLLSESDLALWNFLHTSEAATTTQVSERINHLTSGLGPTIDQFADGIHKIDQFRAAAEQVASRTLAICAEKIAGKNQRVSPDEPRTSPKRDLNNVLRSLSQIDR